MTGHDFRRRHEGIINKVPAELCRKCYLAEETSYHVINECEPLIWERRIYFDSLTGLDVTPDWTLDQLARFLQESSISWWENGNAETLT